LDARLDEAPDPAEVEAGLLNLNATLTCHFPAQLFSR
jgi:hypothetical protein